MTATACCSSDFLRAPALGSVALKHKAENGWRWCVRVLNKHTDIISSVSILILTTCLLADKLFSKIPPILPRASLFILNFGGIIWLNVQVRDFIKCMRDLNTAIAMVDSCSLIVTAAKVFVRAIDVLLTCGLFAAATIAFCGFPQITLLMYAKMRPYAIASFSIGVATQISNYFINKQLLERLNDMDQGGPEISKIMANFTQSVLDAAPPEKSRMTAHIIRQLDTPTIETFQEKFSERKPLANNQEISKIFHAMKGSLQNKQAATEADLYLIALGYVCMGICKIFPGSLVEISLRWGMSVLYTDELIKQKFFQSDLAKKI